FMFKQRGFDPQARMAHSDAESTKIYTENHVQWVEVPHCEIA
ncbi:recombinase, partial [Proteus mirabilis]